MVLLEVMFNESANVTCVSHRANIIGKRLKTIMPLAAKFEESWSYLTNNCPTARRMFLHQAGEPAMRSSEIRWYCWYEIIAQVEKKWDAVVSIITDDREFFKETRQKQRDMLGIAQVGPLRKELRAIVDLGDPLVKLCYRTEGDDTLLSTTVYAHWMKVQGLMEELVNPVTAVPRLRELLPSLHAAQASVTHGRVLTYSAHVGRNRQLWPCTFLLDYVYQYRYCLSAQRTMDVKSHVGAKRYCGFELGWSLRTGLSRLSSTLLKV
jgi:hypothetical protein